VSKKDLYRLVATSDLVPPGDGSNFASIKVAQQAGLNDVEWLECLVPVTKKNIHAVSKLLAKDVVFYAMGSFVDKEGVKTLLADSWEIPVRRKLEDDSPSP
jgi:hypothetical protein